MKGYFTHALCTLVVGGGLNLLATEPGKAAMLYEFTFQDAGGDQTLANTGTVGGTATAVAAGTTNPVFSSDTSGGAGNTWSLNFPKNGGATGVSGPSLTLPDSTDKLRLSGSTDQMTATFWIKWNGPGNRNSAVVGNLSGDQTAGWDIYLNQTTGTINFSRSAGTVNTRTSSGAIGAGVWTFVAVVYQNRSTTFYINGKLDYAAAAFVSPAASSSTVISVGALSGSSPVNGILDNVQLYDTALTAQQISALVAVPEASSMAMVGLGALMLLSRRPRASRLSCQACD